MKRLRLLLAVVFVAALGAAAAVFALAGRVTKPPAETLIEIPRGTSTRTIAQLLAARGVVASEWHFLAARMLRPSVRIQAGEYQFVRDAPASSVLDRLIRGDVHYYELTIPEGANLFEAAQMAASLGWFPADDFLRVSRDPALVAELLPELKPAPESLEGYLFPSTYRLKRNTSAEALVRLMAGEFRKVWGKLDPAARPMGEAVTLASLIEKETGLGAEREVVASVYTNRLKSGMKLDCDPTVIYAALLRGRYRGTIYQSDLESDHPYNTYRHKGLPPGPIANPGEASLRAALHPAATGYLFFVARPDGSGGHTFSINDAQHVRAVAEYRRGLAKQQQAEARRVAR